MGTRELAAFVALTTLSGCHIGFLGVIGAGMANGPYAPETIAKELGPQAARTMGCLDVGFVPHERGGQQLLDFHVGNRCPEPIAVDLRGVVLAAETADGRQVPVKLHDPRTELVVVHIGASERGRERLRIDGAGEVLDRLCLDVQRLAPDAPSSHPPALCFRREASGQWQATGGDLG